MDIWSINPTNGQFEVVGKGKVSADGTKIETFLVNSLQQLARAADPHQQSILRTKLSRRNAKDLPLARLKQLLTLRSIPELYRAPLQYQAIHHLVDRALIVYNSSRAQPVADNSL